MVRGNMCERGCVVGGDMCERGYVIDRQRGVNYLYHDPLHPVNVMNDLLVSPNYDTMLPLSLHILPLLCMIYK